MHGINYEKVAKSLMLSDIYHKLMRLHEYKGEQRAYIHAGSDRLKDFHLAARIQGMEGASCLNGDFVAGYRIKNIYEQREEKTFGKEALIYGYRDLISIISNNYNKIFIQPEFIERLYYELKKYEDDRKDNLYRKIELKQIHVYQNNLRRGSIFLPELKIQEIRPLFQAICQEYVRESAIEEFDNLLLIPVFILDFMCINPFYSRTLIFALALFLLLLYKDGYMIGRYISLEKLIVDKGVGYVNEINHSMKYWENGENDYLPFTRFCLDIMLSAYEEFFERIRISENKELSKPDKVRLIIKKNNRERITKKDIRRLCPDISLSTVEHSLNHLLKSGEIRKVGGGRSTGYIYIGE